MSSTGRSRRAARLAAIQTARRVRRQRLAAGMAVGAAALLLFFLPDCEPEVAGPHKKSPVVSKVVDEPLPYVVNTPIAQPRQLEEAPPEEPPSEERMTRQDRPEFTPTDAEAPPWLDAFRRQVSARSPRLAACFVGVDGPGRLQWTTTVSGIAGRVSDHDVEPIGSRNALSSSEETCLLGVLSAPRYDLRGSDGSAVPARVRLLLAY